MNGDRLPDQVDGGIRPARLHCNDPHEMQGVRMTRIDGEDPAINPLGLGKPALLMEAQRRIKQLCRTCRLRR